MRSFKFRGWDTATNKWAIFGVYLDSNDPNPRTNAISKDLELKNREDVVIMQNTGIIDKNGKEIYEGDILEFKTPRIVWPAHLVGEYFTERHVVRWDEKEARFTTGNSNFGFVNSSEIIGNIYENPELIKL